MLNNFKSGKLVNQMRIFLEKYTSSSHPYVNLIKLGKIEVTDFLGDALHKEAISGNKRALKKVLQTSICVDYPNDKGQTPLFCACARNVENTALLLLQHGANPNEKSFEGLTPTHAVCYMGNVRLLGKLIEAGADLRLHDNDCRTMRDWAQLNSDPSARNRMIDFLDRTHIYAMSFSGDAVSLDRFTKYARRSHKKTSLMEMLKMRTGSDSSFDNLKRVQSMGFGKVYLGNDHSGGIISVIPMISEMILFEVEGTRFETGPVSYMEKMTWLRTTVTVKQVNSDVQHNDGIDLLITDAEYLSKIRHPNVLLLMAISQSINFDTLILVFENIKNCNLFHFLHHKGHRLSLIQEMSLVVQVSSAMEFIHSQGLIHCGLSSLALFMVSDNYVKVGNFEYMVESHDHYSPSAKAHSGRVSLVSTVPHGKHLYNWMAPELIIGKTPCFASDIYSFCSIVWELFAGEVPWDGLRPEAIQHKVVEEGQILSFNIARLPLKLKSLVTYGLVHRPDERLQKFTNILEWLSPDSYAIDPKSKNKSANFASNSSSLYSSSPSSSAENMTSWKLDNLCFPTGFNNLEGGNDSSHIEDFSIQSASETRSSVEANSASNEMRLEDCDQDKSSLSDVMSTGLRMKPASHFSTQCQAKVLKPSGGSLGQLQQRASRPQSSCSEGRASSLPRDFMHERKRSTSSVDETDGVKTDTVKKLTCSFQQRLHQHHLRQAILKGSMAPKGRREIKSSSDTVHNEVENNSDPYKEVTKSSSVDLGDLSTTPVVQCSSTPKSFQRPKADILLKSRYSNLLSRSPGTTCSTLDNRDFKQGKVKFTAMRMEESSLHQTFLEEIMLAHSQIVSKSSCVSEPGACYQSPIVQECQNDLTDSGVGPSCPKSGQPTEPLDESTAVDDLGDGALRSLSEGFLGDSFWDLLPAGKRFDSLDGAKQIDSCRNQVELTGDVCQATGGNDRELSCHIGDYISHKVETGEEKNMNVTFTCTSQDSDIFTTATQEIRPKVISASEEAAGEDNPMIEGTAELNMKFDFEYPEFYIDDDFCYTERTVPTLGSNLFTKQGFSSLAFTQELTQTAEKPKELTHIIEKPKELAHIIEKPKVLTHITEEPKELAHIIEKPKELAHIIEKPKKLTHILEKPKELTHVIEKPPIAPCLYGNLSQSALTDKEKVNSFRAKRSKSEKDVSNQSQNPQLTKGCYPTSKARTGVPIKSAAIVRPRGSDPSLSLSLADVVGEIVADKDEDTLFEVDGIILADESSINVVHETLQEKRNVAKNICSVPTANSAHAIPAANSAYAIPTANSAHAIPTANSAHAIPRVNSAYVIPTANSIYSIPTVNRVSAIPVAKSVSRIPEANSVYAIPAVNSVSTIPAANSVYAIPAVNSVSTIPVAKSVSAMPVAKSVSSLPVSNSAPAIPEAKSVTAIPVSSNVSVMCVNSASIPTSQRPAAVESHSSLGGYRGRNVDDDDSDPWISSKLKSIQEKIQRRNAREFYLISSDDESEKGLELSCAGSTERSMNALGLTKDFTDNPVDVTLNNGAGNMQSDSESKTNVCLWGQPGDYCMDLENLDPVETQSVGTSTTGLFYKKRKKKSSKRRDKILKDNGAINDKPIESRPPSILRKFNSQGNSQDLEKLNSQPHLHRMKSNLSASHGSRSSDRVISFKDVRDADNRLHHEKRLASKNLEKPSEDVEILPRSRPVPAERNLIDRSHGLYPSTVTTWLEKQNFEDRSQENSPCLNHCEKINSRSLGIQFDVQREDELFQSTSKQSLRTKMSFDSVLFHDPVLRQESEHMQFSGSKRDSQHKQNSACKRNSAEKQDSKFRHVSQCKLDAPSRQDSGSREVSARKQDSGHKEVSVRKQDSGHRQVSSSKQDSKHRHVSKFKQDAPSQQYSAHRQVSDHKIYLVNRQDSSVENYWLEDSTKLSLEQKSKLEKKARDQLADHWPKPSGHVTGSKKKRESPADREHCVTFELQTPTNHQSKRKIDTKVFTTGIHRFYIPRDMCPSGCQTRLDVRTSPTHPDCQRVTTTAFNASTGQMETLLDKTIRSDRLRTTLQID